jgi:cysteine desulfurase
VEHHAVLNSCKALEREGWSITYLPTDEYGMVNPSDVEKAITPQTVLISIMHANNEVGTIEPIAEIGGIARAHKITFHTDAVQSFEAAITSTIGIDLVRPAIRYTGRRGGLAYRKGTKILPIMFGAMERSLQPGTENARHSRRQGRRTLFAEGS